MNIMSIFINEDVKKRYLYYWFGLGAPIIIGFGITLFSFIFLMIFGENFLNDKYFFIVGIIVIFANLGHLVIWPLSAWWLKSHANTIGEERIENGARMSIKLYLVWIVFVILPNVWFAINFNGIV